MGPPGPSSIRQPQRDPVGFLLRFGHVRLSRTSPAEQRGSRAAMNTHPGHGGFVFIQPVISPSLKV